jgi:hypothetical protein
MALAARYMPFDTFFFISLSSICIFSLAVLSRIDVKREVMINSRFITVDLVFEAVYLILQLLEPYPQISIHMSIPGRASNPKSA